MSHRQVSWSLTLQLFPAELLLCSNAYMCTCIRCIVLRDPVLGDENMINTDRGTEAVKFLKQNITYTKLSDHIWSQTGCEIAFISNNPKEQPTSYIIRLQSNALSSNPCTANLWVFYRQLIVCVCVCVCIYIYIYIYIYLLYSFVTTWQKHVRKYLGLNDILHVVQEEQQSEQREQLILKCVSIQSLMH